MNIQKTERINQMLRERKAQRNKVEKYRNDRIKHKYDKIKAEVHQKQHQQAEVLNTQDQRKIDFYKQVFEQLPKSNTNRNHKSQKYVPEKIQSTVKSNPEEEEHLSQGQDNHNTQNATKIELMRNKTQIGNNRHKINQKMHQQGLKSRQKTFQHKNSKFQRRERPKFIKHNKTQQKYQNNNKFDDQNEQNRQLNQMFRNADKLKQRKKKFIKKMDQRTSKGQPVMKNYIKYALTKLEGDILKQKIDKVDPNAYKNKNNNKGARGKPKSRFQKY